MLPRIKKEYLDGRLMLFLGAGASAGSLDYSGNPIPLGNTLAKELAEEIGWNYNNEPLSVVYSAFESQNSAKLYQYLQYRLTNTKPSKAYLSITRYPWSRIYTTNIDDCLERAIKSKSSQRLNSFNFASNLEEIDTLFQTVQLIKLNGCTNNPKDGFIFSPQEYGEKSSRLPPWYRELAQNSGSYTFLYIGSRLNEPILQHIFAMMREELSRSPLQGYVITPNATEIEKHHLNSLNLTHISGTVADFANWMKLEIPKVPSDWDLATARRPEYKHLKVKFTLSQKRAINNVTVVSPDALPRNLDATDSGSIRNFYKGFKPTWRDIVDDVPARISQIEQFVEKIRTESKIGKCFA
ncbi:MAG: SIR2 family protein [Rhodospirillaceae bacterium]|nr:SIR2 family protein [Rhodospirillaceae bacterium]